MPDPFATLALPLDTRARLLLIHPVTRAPLLDETGEQGWVETRSWESEEAQQHRMLRDNAARKLGREFTAEEDWADMGAMLARLTIAWHLVGLDGRALNAPCSFELASQAYSSTGLRWLRNAVLAHLNTTANFFPLDGSTPAEPSRGKSSGSTRS